MLTIWSAIKADVMFFIFRLLYFAVLIAYKNISGGIIRLFKRDIVSASLLIIDEIWV